MLTGDLGYSVLEAFADKFPDRFFNVGVAEQNMVGLATGLAEAGFIPFLYSIATFASMRPYEFIRNGPILHRLPVRIIGVGGGFEYGTGGTSHHGLEDIGIMRIQPGIAVISPVDYAQTRTALLKTWDLSGPVYYRLGKDDSTIIPGLAGDFELGRAQTICKGADLLIIATGSIANEALAAAETLKTRGVACTVMVVASFNPAPVDDLADMIAHFHLVLTVEEHFLVGALGSLVSEVVAEQGLNCQVVRCGVRTIPDGTSGSQNYLRHKHKISSTELVNIALHSLHKINK